MVLNIPAEKKNTYYNMSKEGRDNTVISREFLICRLTNFETFDAEEEIFIHLDKESFLGN
mgnify:CR=1 FL=1